jgi:pimeloyl-ACP methyl ester carboxylesterase
MPTTVTSAVPPRNTPDREGVVELEDGRSIGYAEYGPSDGRVVLWFHGTPGAARQVPPDAPDLARRHGLRLIGMDRPGTGRSSNHRHAQIAGWAGDVEQALDAWQVDRCAVVGLSGGGPFVLACASQLPDRVVVGAVLGGLGPTRGPEASPGYTRILPPLEPFLSVSASPLGAVFSCLVKPVAARLGSPAFEIYSRFIAPSCDRPVLARPDMKEVFLYDIEVAARTGLRATMHDLLLFGRDWGFLLSEIEVPIRFWHGDADKIVPLGHGVNQAALVPDSELTVVPGGGHFSGYETVEEVFSTVLDLWPSGADRASA